MTIYWNFIPRSTLAEILFLQRELRMRKESGDIRNYIICTEHQECFTYAKQTDLNDHRISSTEFAEFIKQTRIPVQQCRRGGGITYHGPGQLTVYFAIDTQQLLDIKARSMGNIIDQNIIRLLRLYGLKSYTWSTLSEIKNKKQTSHSTTRQDNVISFPRISIPLLEGKKNQSAAGVWVIGSDKKTRKIASRATHINSKRTVITFGCAINITTDLYPLNNIIKPCGLDIEMTSLLHETGRSEKNMHEVAQLFVSSFANLTNSYIAEGIPES